MQKRSLRKALADLITPRSSKSSLPPVMNYGHTPYLGVDIPTLGTTEWNYDKYFQDQVKVQNEENHDIAPDRRGIHDSSAYNYLFGMARIGFDLQTCNIVKTNPFFILNQSILFDYLRQVEFNVVDKDGNRKDDLYDWFKNPNPQQGFWEVWLAAVGDLLAYDAGVVVVTYTKGGYANELKAYRGDEFWIETDRMLFEGKEVPMNGASSAYLSHGYTTRYWQHSNTGLFIPYRPEEVLYLMRYPQSGSPYGQDIMKYFRFHYRGLMSATVAYGKIMDNGLNAGIVMKHPDIGSIEVLQERLEGLRKVNGGPTNVGKPLHLIGNEEVSTISNNNLMNQQFIEGQKFNATLIANIFGLPASEFSFESGGSRMSSLSQKDIRKSRGVGTILSIIAERCNTVLKRLKGYEEGDKFYFEEISDIDDQLKEAYVVSQNLSSFKLACPNAVFPIDVALKLVSFGKQLSPEERDRIYDMVQDLPQAPSDAPDNARVGRYNGSDSYQETFVAYKDVALNENEMRALKEPQTSE